MVYTLMPHAHLRGKASRFTAPYPDGRREVLLNVPRYDFCRQTTIRAGAAADSAGEIAGG